MGKRNRVIGPILGLVLVASLVIMPSAVGADDVYYYPTEDCMIYEDDPDENHGTSSWLAICNWYNGPSNDHRGRSVIKIADQSGGGNVTSVMLRLYYGDEFGEDAEGLEVRVYRLTREFVETEVTWVYYEDGEEWTAEGGDYTTANYATADMPSEGNYVTWNITDMALDAWIDDEQDLYVLVRFKNETADEEPEMSWSFFRSAEGGSNRPRVTVSYAEEVQTPEVDSDIAEYGSEYVEVNIYPTLYDWPSANVTAQVAPHGGAWTWESSLLTVTDNNAVTRTVSSLNHSTQYDVRAKLVYGSGTVYSSNSTFTTLAYDVPTWNVGVDDIFVHEVGFHIGWTANNDNESVTARLLWREKGNVIWNYEDSHSSSETIKTWGETVDELADDRTYEYKGRFTIGGYSWETDVAEVTTLDGVFLDVTVSDVDLEYIQLKVDYDAEDVDEFDLDARNRLYGGALWHDSETIEALSGNGTEYFLFEDLRAMREYEWQVIASWDGGSSTFSGRTWTSGIDSPPELSNLDATFVAPNIMRVSCDVVLNDADYLDPPLYVKYKRTDQSTWSTSHDETSVTDDGEWTVDVICGDELFWETGYNYYMEIDYTAGTSNSTEDIFYTPAEPLAVETVGVTGITGTSAYFRALAQLEDYDGLYLVFEYWVSGSLEDTYTRSDYLWLTNSGSYQIRVDDLVFGEDYQMQAMITDTTGAGPPLAYGGIYEFRCGFWGGDEPSEGDDTFAVYGDIFNWFKNSTPGHWTILLLGMGALALIFHRRKEIAIVLCLMVLGIGIIIGWVDTWIIVLLGIGVGLWVWRLVRGQRQGGAI